MTRRVVIAVFAALGLIALGAAFTYQTHVDALRAERDAVLQQGVIADQSAWQAKQDEVIAADFAYRIICFVGVGSLGAVVWVALGMDLLIADLTLRSGRRAVIS